jgi:hypothetical protein
MNHDKLQNATSAIITLNKSEFYDHNSLFCVSNVHRHQLETLSIKPVPGWMEMLQRKTWKTIAYLRISPLFHLNS